VVPGGGEHQRAWEQEALGGIQSRVAVTDPAPGLPSVETMVLSESHRQHWLQLCAAETDALERRRALLRQAARAVAASGAARGPLPGGGAELMAADPATLRRLLDRLTLATERRPAVLSADSARALGLLLGFRHVVRHHYADDIDPEQVHQRLRGALEQWPRLRDELQALRSLAAGADRPHRQYW